MYVMLVAGTGRKLAATTTAAGAEGVCFAGGRADSRAEGRGQELWRGVHCLWSGKTSLEVEGGPGAYGRTTRDAGERLHRV